MMNLILAIISISKMIGIFDKWLEKFTEAYIEQKRKDNRDEFLKAIEKSKTKKSTLDLQRSIGEHLDD